MLANSSAKTLRYSMAILVGLMLVLPVQAADGQDSKPTPKQQWSDLLHYINIARAQLAQSYGKAILENKDISSKQIYILSVENRESLQTLRKGMKLEGMKEIIEQLRARIEEGYKAWRADPTQIEESILLMGQSLRAYMIGKQRLKESGEYAIPMLVQKLTDPKAPKLLKERIVTMLHEMGRGAVRPYSVALQSKDLKLVGFLAHALGRIEYPSALPRLRETLLRPELKDPNGPTRKIIVAAIISCAGGDRSAVNKSPAELFYGLAEKYYDRAESLLPDQRHADQTAFVWFWKKGLGLEARPVPAEILCDIYAMRMSRLALKHDASFYPAVPLWLSACIRREIDLPKGKTDPLWGKDQPRAEFYALASSPRYLQMVLARALKDANVGIAGKVIETMGMNTGAPSLIKPLAGGSQPLVGAMGYPDRGVRFLAAQTLALAMPTEKFHGYQVVMSLMNEALRQKGQKFAMVVVKDPQRRNATIDAVRAAGFEIIDEADTDKLLISAGKATGLDVVLVGPDTPAGQVIDSFRREPIYHYMPIVVHKFTVGMRDRAAKDGKIVILDSAKTDGPSIAKALADAVALSSGKPLSEKQATDWAIRAARTIRTVGMRGNVVYDVRRTADALAEVLAVKNSELQVAAAGALAVVPDSKAQQAVIDLALKSDADQKVRIAAFQAASESVRRFANKGADAQGKALVELVTNPGPHELLEAAAQLLGTMNLPSEKIPELIYSADKID